MSGRCIRSLAPPLRDTIESGAAPGRRRAPPGHAGTASGICGILEAYQQMAGRAAGIQVQRADRAVVHAYGSMLCSHVTVVLEGS